MPAIEACLQNAEKLISAAHTSAVFSGSPTLLEALDSILPRATESMSVQTLRLQPFIATHRNQTSEEPFLLPKERFGSTQDIALVPLVRHVVDDRDDLRNRAGTRLQRGPASRIGPSARRASGARDLRGQPRRPADRDGAHLAGTGSGNRTLGSRNRLHRSASRAAGTY